MTRKRIVRTTGLVILVATPARIWAQNRTPSSTPATITSADVDAACKNRPTSSTVTTLDSLCLSIDQQDPRLWPTVLPTVAQINSAKIKSATIARGPSYTVPGTAGAVSPETEAILVVTDALVDLAKTELEQYVVTRFGTILCDTPFQVLLRPSITTAVPKSTKKSKKEQDTKGNASAPDTTASPTPAKIARQSLRSLFPLTCDVLKPPDPDEEGRGTLPGVGTVQAAVRKDAGGLSAKVLALLADSTLVPRLHDRDRALAAGSVLFYLTLIADDKDPYIAFGSLRDSISRMVRDNSTVQLDSMPYFKNLAAVATAAGSIDHRWWTTQTRDANFKPETTAWYILAAYLIDAQAAFAGKLAPSSSNIGVLVNSMVTVTRVFDAVDTALTIARSRSAKSDERALGALRAVLPLFTVALANDTIASDVGRTMREMFTHLERLPEDVVSRQYADLIVELSSVLQTIAVDSLRMSAPVRRLVGFAVDISESKDAASMQAAVEKFVAPVGSFQKKREGGSKAHPYAEVNAYVGGAVGGEVVPGKGGGLALAPYLPVGFEAGLSGSRLAIFLPLVDLGQFAAWRVTTGSQVGKAPPDLKVANVLAPGVYGLWGVSRTLPLSIGVGMTYAPNFRTISTKTGQPGGTSDVLRYNAIVALDLPLFP